MSKYLTQHKIYVNIQIYPITRNSQMNVQNIVSSLVITAMTIVSLPNVASAAQPGNRDLACNRGSQNDITRCIFNRDGVGFLLSVNGFCAQEYGNRWYGTGRMGNGRRECQQKKWFQV
jgi:hypothetical protein